MEDASNLILNLCFCYKNVYLKYLKQKETFAVGGQVNLKIYILKMFFKKRHIDGIVTLLPTIETAR